MKTKTLNLFILLALMLTLCTGLFFVPTNTFANAESSLFHSEERSNDYFSMSMSAQSRIETVGNITLDENKQTVTNEADEEITYLVFNWRELESLKFNFSSTIAHQPLEFTSVKFLVTNFQTENLEDSVGNGTTTELFSKDITENLLPQIDFYYHIDKDSDTEESSNRRRGNDFGLYKFDYIYSYMNTSFETPQETSVSLGAIYVAVIPDKPETIVDNDIKIIYSISSSNKLMNVFNLYFSTDSYKYVNPENLQWSVEGMDKSNINYVLSKEIKNSNLDKYANFKTIYEAYTNPVGTRFIFDSNDIEGIWTVSCKIFNSDNSLKDTLYVENLSTIKLEEKSYLWLIILLVIVGVLLIGSTILIVIYKKKEKL